MCSKACKYSSSERRSFPRLWLILLFITVFSLVVLSPLTGAEKESPGASVLAVAPFENLSGKSEQGYIAFQIYEFMTTLFSELEEWKVVERKDLKKVFDEQKLQLSGITGEDGAVELGNILNAGKILSGSYLVEGERITLYGRIIDTETGEVVQSSQASDSFTNGAGTAMEKLFYSLTGRYAGGRKGDAEVSGDRAGLAEGTEPLANLLLSALEENRWSADVEARLELIRSRGEEQSRELARALEADFSRNDEESLSRLEAIVQNARDNPIGFADTADRYWEQYTRLRGKGIYADMLKQQLDLNSTLSRESEALTLYRNKIRVFSDTLYTILQPEMFGMDNDFEADIDIEGSSAVVKLPDSVKIHTEKSLRSLVDKLIEEHDLLWSYNGKIGFSNVKKPDVSTLLPEAGDIQELVDFTIDAAIGFSLEFLNGEGEVLFALDSEPSGSIFSLTTGGELRFDRTLENVVYRIRKKDPQWNLEGSRLQIQPEALKQLASVRRVINPDSFTVSRLFPLYSNSRWRSLILHAFRLRFSPLGEDDRPFPEVKEVALANSFFRLEGIFPEEADWIPLLPSSIEGKELLLPGEDLQATVYWGARSEAVVEASWKGSGLEEREAQSFTRQLEEGSVFTLSAPSTPGEGSLILEDKRSGGRIETPFRVAPRGSVILRKGKKGKDSLYRRILPDRHSGESYLLMGRNKVMVEQTTTGDTVWSKRLSYYGHSFRHSNSVGIIKKNRKIEVLDLLSGEELYRIDDIYSDLELPEKFQDKKYKEWLGDYSIYGLAASQKYIVWTLAYGHFNGSLLFSLERSTGTTRVWSSSLKTRSLKIHGDYLHLHRERNHGKDLFIMDLRSGDMLTGSGDMQLDYIRYSSTSGLLFQNEDLYVVAGNTAFEAGLEGVIADGRISSRDSRQWTTELRNIGASGRSPSQVLLREGRLYTVRGKQLIACLDAVTGELIWEKAHPVGDHPRLELDNGVLRFSGFTYGGENERSLDPLNRDKKELVHRYKEIDPATGELLLEGYRSFESNWSANSLWSDDPLEGPRGRILFYSKGRRDESPGGYMLLSRDIDPAALPALEADKLYEEVLF